MKSFLLSWYGVTDLKASLGLDESTGPVLRALETCKYTHLLLLAYTDPKKAAGVGIPEGDRDRAGGRTGNSPEPVPARGGADADLDSLLNTNEGHEHYKQWLRSEIKKRNLGVAIRVVPMELAGLSDARGIYAAAREALDVVLAVEGEKEVTFYISPGTPVMAFSWAFAALLNSDHGVRIIESSDPRLPPQSVELPYDVLKPSSRKRVHVVPAGGAEFDTVFHLFGEQPLPSLLGLRQFPAQRHVFVTSDKYPAGKMKRFVPAGAEFSELRIDPYDPMSARLVILESLAELPHGKRLGFNLTGGTKLMYAGAQSACRQAGGVPFYFEARDNRVMFLDTFETQEIKGIDNVELFMELAGFRVSRAGRWADEPVRESRRELTRVLWRHRGKISRLYRQLSDVLDNGRGRPFSVRMGGVSAALDSSLRGTLVIDGVEEALDGAPDWASYLCGGWLEEYVYQLVEPSFVSGRVLDLRIGLEVAWRQNVSGGTVTAAQEFDCVFTDGKKLYIVECKAGQVYVDYVYKLENIVRRYGGTEAKGILVAAFAPPPSPRRRLENARSLSWYAGKGVSESIVDDALGR